MSRNAADHPREADVCRGGVAARLLRSAVGHRGQLLFPRTQGAQPISGATLVSRVEALAAGFLQLGVRKGDRVALVLDNCPEWLLIDLALLSIGGVDVPRASDTAPDDLAFVVTHAGCKGAILAHAGLLPRLGHAALQLSFIIVLSDGPSAHTTLAAVEARGRSVLAEDPHAVERANAEVHDHTLATLIYTSGTTGNPKGVMLSHGNLLHNIQAVPEVLALRAGQRYLSFLPVWHSFERMLDYVVLDRGLELHYGSTATLRDDLQRIRPQLLAAVPRLYESMLDQLLNRLSRLQPILRRFVAAVRAGSLAHYRVRMRCAGRRATPDGSTPRTPYWLKPLSMLTAAATWPLHALANRLIHRPLRNALGGQVELLICGGGALSERVDEAYLCAGFALLNGYGLTETSPVLSVRQPTRLLQGSAGPPLPATEFRILDPQGVPLPQGQQGLITVRGPQVMQGYWQNAAGTSQVLSEAGWFSTGDLGRLTPCGCIMITGRAKDTLVLTGGENVEPEPLEARIQASPWIADVVVVGHAQKQLAALVLPDFEALRRAGHVGPPEVITNLPAVRELIAAELRALTGRGAGLPAFQTVGAFHLLTGPFSIEDGTLTATHKKRRAVIETRYREEIAKLG